MADTEFYTSMIVSLVQAINTPTTSLFHFLTLQKHNEAMIQRMGALRSRLQAILLDAERTHFIPGQSAQTFYRRALPELRNVARDLYALSEELTERESMSSQVQSAADGLKWSLLDIEILDDVYPGGMV